MFRTLLLVLLAASGCGSASTDDTDTDGSSTSGSTTTGSTSSGQPSSTGSSSTDADDSSSSGEVTTDESTSGSSGSSDSTDTGDGSSSDSTGEPEVSPYAGDYEGTATVVCFNKMETTDEFVFAVAEDGTLTGTVGSGDVAGTVDLEGTVAVPLELEEYGTCTMDGVIDELGNATGTITCMELPCEGTWEASRVP